MIIKSKHFGNLEIDEKEIINFPKGIYGFEKSKKFVLLGDMENLDNPFKWLHSVDDPDACFVVVDPKCVDETYKINVQEQKLDILDIEDVNNVLLLSIVVIPDLLEQMTANLKSPIIINTENNYGMQIILDDEKYRVKQSILKK